MEGSLYTGGEALKNLEGREIRPYLDFHIPETSVEGPKTKENGKKAALIAREAVGCFIYAARGSLLQQRVSGPRKTATG